MSSLYYGSSPGLAPSLGGFGVLLTRLEVLSYEREPQWLGPDYLFTTYRLRVRGIFNPEVNAYDLVGGAFSPYQAPEGSLGPTAVASTGLGFTRDQPLLSTYRATNPNVTLVADGTLPTNVGPGQSRQTFAVHTDRAIRDWMMQPRRQLIFSIGVTPSLVSPSINSDGTVANVNGRTTTDAWNGPVPLSCDVVAVSGTKTFLVDYAIETYVNESQIFVTKPSVLLAHRWSATEDIDQDFYQTRTIKGVARFRTDRLAYLGNLPDDFRQLLFHPMPGGGFDAAIDGYAMPVGWKRTLINVDAAEDGSTLSYALVDKQVYLNVVPECVSRIEAFMTVGANPFTPEGSAEGLAKIVGVGGSSSNEEEKKFPGLALAMTLLPQTEFSVTFRVWGYPFNTSGDGRSVREVLRAVALLGCAIRLSTINAVAKFSGATRVEHTEDLGGTFVEMTVTKATALVASSFQGIVNLTPAPLLFNLFGGGNAGNPGALGEASVNVADIPNVLQYFSLIPGDDSTPGILEFARMSTTQSQGLLTVNNSQNVNTRGGLLVQLATAALLNPHPQAVLTFPPPPAPTSGFASTSA